jgi:hypothetical protein
MTMRCIVCQREVEQGLLCSACARRQGEKPKLNCRLTRRELYRRDPRPTPPITLRDG